MFGASQSGYKLLAMKSQKGLKTNFSKGVSPLVAYLYFLMFSSCSRVNYSALLLISILIIIGSSTSLLALLSINLNESVLLNKSYDAVISKIKSALISCMYSVNIFDFLVISSAKEKPL